MRARSGGHVCLSGSHIGSRKHATPHTSVLVSHSQPARLVHELALMESVVETVVDQLGDQRVALVRLEIGELAGVAIDAMRFSFDVCVQGTPLDGATLEIVTIGGLARCNACGTERATRSFATPCECGSFDRQLVRGDELRLVEVEVI